jgi:hypothetical protein
MNTLHHPHLAPELRDYFHMNRRLATTLQEQENPDIIGVFAVARPGLEPGTPRFQTSRIDRPMRRMPCNAP